jgi:hypothetical protein
MALVNYYELFSTGIKHLGAGDFDANWDRAYAITEKRQNTPERHV